MEIVLYGQMGKNDYVGFIILLFLKLVAEILLFFVGKDKIGY